MFRPAFLVRRRLCNRNKQVFNAIRTLKCSPMRMGMAEKPKLLITLDAFGTIYEPKAPVPEQYAEIAEKHGLKFTPEEIEQSFKEAFKSQRAKYPNYGKAAGMDAARWWTEIITKTFTPLIAPNQTIPEKLAEDLLHRFSSSDGYRIFPDALPFIGAIHAGKINAARARTSQTASPVSLPRLKYHATVLGVISNSDARVVSILESFGITVDVVEGVSRRRKEAVGYQQKSEGLVEKLMEDKTMVDFVTLSYDVDSQKPNREIFDAGKEQAKIFGGEGDWLWYHIGDDVREDVLGAEAAGGKGILLDRSLEGKWEREVSIEGIGWDDRVVTVGSLFDVLDILDTPDVSVHKQNPIARVPPRVHFIH